LKNRWDVRFIERTHVIEVPMKSHRPEGVVAGTMLHGTVPLFNSFCNLEVPMKSHRPEGVVESEGTMLHGINF
jgi:hypothetical protein